MQALLLAAQVIGVYWYCLALYWSPSEVSGTARAHLRAFAALKSLSFVFSALQLRSGYPPPASYQCGHPAPDPHTTPFPQHVPANFMLSCPSHGLTCGSVPFHHAGDLAMTSAAHNATSNPSSFIDNIISLTVSSAMMRL